MTAPKFQNKNVDKKKLSLKCSVQCVRKTKGDFTQHEPGVDKQAVRL